MIWQICIQYPNGKERVLRCCHDREVALRYIDAIYSQGYPLHVAYIVRPIKAGETFPTKPLQLAIATIAH